MAEVNTAMVKQLRQRTGAGMMDCKNALVEAEGNEERAVELIQKKGLAKAAKKAGAIATEGVVHSYIHPGSRVGVLVEVNCQTDFVARNADFQTFVENVALQIASMAPLYLELDAVPADARERQNGIFKAQLDEEATNTGKARPPQAVAKILEGKLAKWGTEVCLLDQPSILESSQTVRQAQDALSAKVGEKVAVRRFVRFELGEGVEVAKKDLAAEVAEVLAN